MILVKKYNFYLFSFYTFFRSKGKMKVSFYYRIAKEDMT